MPMEIAVYHYVFSIEFAESIFMKFTIGKQCFKCNCICNIIFIYTSAYVGTK